MKQTIDAAAPSAQTHLADPKSHPINWDISPDRQTLFALAMNGNQLRGVNGVKVTYRPSYSSAVPNASTIDALRVADILENDIPQTGVTTSIAVRGKTIDVEVPARELIALGRPANAEAEALLYVYSGRSIVAFKDKRISIDAARVDATKPLHLVESFDLPPGRYVAKVLLRVDGTDALGFARTPMNVE